MITWSIAKNLNFELNQTVFYSILEKMNLSMILNQEQQIVMYGLYDTNPYSSNASKPVAVATFDSEQQAHDYAKSVRLKEPKAPNWEGPHIFRKGSLLEDYDSYILEVYSPEYLPHNPL